MGKTPQILVALLLWLVLLALAIMLAELAFRSSLGGQQLYPCSYYNLAMDIKEHFRIEVNNGILRMLLVSESAMMSKDSSRL